MSPVHSLTKRSGERLFYLDLRAGRIKRALNANALAFELGNVGLVIDVIGLAGIILQHILVAGFHDCSRECLASTRGGGGIGHVVLRAGGLRLIRSLRRRRLLRRRRCIGRRSGLRLRSLLRRRRVRCRRRLRCRLICRSRRCGLSERAAPGDQAKDHCQGGDKSKRLNPIFHKSSRSQAAHPSRVSKLRAITSSRLAAPLVRREKEIGFARLSERSSGSPDAQFRHCFFPDYTGRCSRIASILQRQPNDRAFLAHPKENYSVRYKANQRFSSSLRRSLWVGYPTFRQNLENKNATFPENEVVVLSYEVWPPEMNASPFPSTEVSPPKSLIGTQRRGPRPARPSRKTQFSFPA